MERMVLHTVWYHNKDRTDKSKESPVKAENNMPVDIIM